MTERLTHLHCHPLCGVTFKLHSTTSSATICPWPGCRCELLHGDPHCIVQLLRYPCIFSATPTLVHSQGSQHPIPRLVGCVTSGTRRKQQARRILRGGGAQFISHLLNWYMNCHRRAVDEDKRWLRFDNIVSSKLEEGPTPPSGGGSR